MEIDKKITKILSPPRTNFSNMAMKNNISNTLKTFIKSSRKIKSHDNSNFSLINYKNKNSLTNSKTFPTIIYNHSYGSNKHEGLYILKFCEKYDLDLCIYDSKASGSNTAKFITFGFEEKIDLLFVILKLNLEFNCEKFILWGRSIGCNSILQFYQTMISNESTFLNNIKKKKRKEENFFMSNVFLNKNEDLPNNFNQFLSDHLQSYILNNENFSQEDFSFNFKFTITGIILDSPYSCFSEFIKDNLKKFLPFMSNFLSIPLVYYLKNYFLKKIKVDLYKKQNIDIISVVNLNTVFIISEKDELIPYNRFLNLVKNFASKFMKKNKPQIFNTKQKHRSKRDNDLTDNSICHILSNENKNNTFTFCHIQKNPFFVKKLNSNIRGIQSIKKWVSLLKNNKDKFLNEFNKEEVSTNNSDNDIQKKNSTEEKIILQNINKIDVDNIINIIKPKENENEKKINKKNKYESLKIVLNKNEINNSIVKSPMLTPKKNFNKLKKRSSTQKFKKHFQSNRYVVNNHINPPVKFVVNPPVKFVVNPPVKFMTLNQSSFINTNQGRFIRIIEKKFVKKGNPLQCSIIKK